MKFLFSLLIGLLLLGGCVPQPVAQEPSLPENIEERIDEEQNFTQPEIPEEEPRVLGERLVGNQSATQQGVFVNLKGIFYNNEEKRFYFDISAENLNERPETRDALQWKAILYFTRDEQNVLFLCDFENNDEQWNAQYCEERRNIPSHWHNQKMWLIYTLQDPNIFREGKSVLDALREEDTFAFKIVIPKP